jgi:hypothetical protein
MVRQDAGSDASARQSEAVLLCRSPQSILVGGKAPGDESGRGWLLPAQALKARG